MKLEQWNSLLAGQKLKCARIPTAFLHGQKFTIKEAYSRPDAIFKNIEGMTQALIIEKDNFHTAIIDYNNWELLLE